MFFEGWHDPILPARDRSLTVVKHLLRIDLDRRSVFCGGHSGGLWSKCQAGSQTRAQQRIRASIEHRYALLVVIYASILDVVYLLERSDQIIIQRLEELSHEKINGA
jgi:hypothetical protein